MRRGMISAALRVAPLGQPVDQGLGHVLDDGKTTGHVAVEGAVAGGHLALVAGGQHDVAGLVGQRHQQRAADAGLQVLFGRVFGPAGKLLGQAGAEGIEHRRDRDLVVAHAQALCHVAGVDPGDVGGVGRGHHHGADLVGAERVDRDGQHQGRVDAARQTDDGAGEAVFAQVVAHARDQRGPGLGFQAGQRVRGCRAPGRRRPHRTATGVPRSSAPGPAPRPTRPRQTRHRRTPPRPGRRPGGCTATAGRRRAPARPSGPRARPPCPGGTATRSTRTTPAPRRRAPGGPARRTRRLRRSAGRACTPPTSNTTAPCPASRPEAK